MSRFLKMTILAAAFTLLAVSAHTGPPSGGSFTIVKSTIDGAHRAGKWVGLCGELAGDPVAAPILLGLGLDEFSMAPAQIPTLKAAIRALSLENAQWLAQHALACPDAAAVRALARAAVERQPFQTAVMH